MSKQAKKTSENARVDTRTNPLGTEWIQYAQGTTRPMLS